MTATQGLALFLTWVLSSHVLYWELWAVLSLFRRQRNFSNTCGRRCAFDWFALMHLICASALHADKPCRLPSVAAFLGVIDRLSRVYITVGTCSPIYVVMAAYWAMDRSRP